jgi:putative hydrolase of the HAD superfamily
MRNRQAYDRGVTEYGTVVWDLGGVVLRWDPIELIADTLAASPGESIPPRYLPDRAVPDGTDPAPDRIVEALVSAVFQDFTADSDWSAFDRGILDVEELRARICHRTGLGASMVTAILGGIPSHLRFRPETEYLVDRVAAAGHRVVFLSNMPPPYADWLESESRFTTRFTAGVFSCRVHAVKPEPEIYRIAERELGLDAGATLLIDDRSANLGPAADRGWSGLRFRTVDRCGTDLERLGWL